jgi:hypothetical protein
MQAVHDLDPGRGGQHRAARRITSVDYKEMVRPGRLPHVDICESVPIGPWELIELMFGMH